MPIPQSLIIALSLLVVSFPLLAQDDGGDSGPQFTEKELKDFDNLPPIPGYQKRKPGEISFAVVCSPTPNEDYFYIRDGKPEKIQFNSGTIRRFQSGVFPDGVVFLRVSKESESGYAAVGRAKPGDAREGIIVFHPKAESSDAGIPNMPFIDLSKSSFSPGQVRLLNLTPLPILARLADGPAQVEPLGSIVRTPSGTSGLFPLHIAVVSEGKTRMIYSNTFQAEKSMRILFLIVPDRMNTNASSPARCMIYKDKGFVSQ